MRKPRFRHQIDKAKRVLLIEFKGRVFALDTWTMDQMTALIQDHPKHKILYTSCQNDAFCAGLDLRQMEREGTGKGQLEAFVNLLLALARHPSPTVCLVQSPAVAGGIGLALAADVVLMGCGSYFRLPPHHLYYPLARLLFPFVAGNRQVTLEEFEQWYGNRISAHRLQSVGYVDAVLHRQVPSNRVKDVMLQLASRVMRSKDFKKRPRRSIKRIDQAEIHRRLDHAIAQSQELEFQRRLERERQRVKRDPKGVFVVYGRASDKTRKIKELVKRDCKLHVIDFGHAADSLFREPKFVWDIVMRGMALAKAVIVLLTEEDTALLCKPYNDGSEPKRRQARPNVYIEAGMALGQMPRETLLVAHENSVIPSDLGGIWYIPMRDSDEEWKSRVVERLVTLELLKKVPAKYRR